MDSEQKNPCPVWRRQGGPLKWPGERPERVLHCWIAIRRMTAVGQSRRRCPLDLNQRPNVRSGGNLTTSANFAACSKRCSYSVTRHARAQAPSRDAIPLNGEVSFVRK